MKRFFIAAWDVLVIAGCGIAYIFLGALLGVLIAIHYIICSRYAKLVWAGAYFFFMAYYFWIAEYKWATFCLLISLLWYNLFNNHPRHENNKL